MAPRKNNFIPDMRETRYKTETFANPYAPIAPKQTAFRTPKMSATAMPNSGFDLGGFLKWGFGGPISQEQRAINQAKEDTSKVTLFGKTVQTSDLLGVVASAALGAAGIAAVRSGMKVRASTRSLASSRAINADAIEQNSVRARVQFREAVDVRRAARQERRSTNVRAARLERAEAALADSNPSLALAAGDRAYSFRRGNAIRPEMATSPTIGAGIRGNVGARSFPNDDQGPRRSYRPVSESEPAGVVSYPVQGVNKGSNDAFEWLRKTAGYSDSYGRTGMDRLVGMYPGGVPKGGWSKQPNLRKRNPLPSRFDKDGNRVITPGEMADGPQRDRVAALLDDANSFRNRSAQRMQDGRTAFPKSHSWMYDPQYAPESYQLKVIKAAEAAAAARRLLPAPKKKIGKGK